jgi:hypothetical protein
MNAEIYKHRTLIALCGAVAVIVLVVALRTDLAPKKVQPIAENVAAEKPVNEGAPILGNEVAQSDHAAQPTSPAFAAKKPTTKSGAAGKAAEGAASLATVANLFQNTKATPDARRAAGEALLGTGTRTSASLALRTILQTFDAGRTEEGLTLATALASPVSPEAAEPFFDLLLGRGEFAPAGAKIPEELRLSLRKALRAAPESESVGRYSVGLYAQLEASNNEDALRELVEGVSHPVMLAELAVRAHGAGRSEEATRFMDQIIATKDTSVVSALIKLATADPSMLSEASETAYNWSLRNPAMAQVGVFAGHITDTRAPKEARIVAAFGLAGCADASGARRTLEKARSAEADPGIRAQFEAAVANIAPLPNSGVAPDANKP